MIDGTRGGCANARVAEQAVFERAAAAILNDLGEEMRRQLRLQQQGRFERACTHPSHTDASNYAISMEEVLEVVEELDALKSALLRSAMGVTKAMQHENKSHDLLEKEVLQAAATFAGWLVRRKRVQAR